MKIALLACIHGNARALADVLSHARRKGAEEIHALGDLVGGGPSPLATVKLLRRNEVRCLAGEWDVAVATGKPLPPGACGPAGDAAQALEETRDALDAASLAWLRSLPAGTRFARAGRTFALAHGHGPRGVLAADVLVLGHLHTPSVARSSTGLLLQPGAVGDGPEASYVLLDDQALAASVERVLVDVRVPATA
ncbi:MAG TPA: metallophosphoesterase family protein [Candidatus Thermoplasmatota archaeon]|nr:metallophosphoesterase family protein [Candidatus Thermoplasmatota archaeon]